MRHGIVSVIHRLAMVRECLALSHSQQVFSKAPPSRRRARSDGSKEIVRLMDENLSAHVLHAYEETTTESAKHTE